MRWSGAAERNERLVAPPRPQSRVFINHRDSVVYHGVVNYGCMRVSKGRIVKRVLDETAETEVLLDNDI